jgi:transketolase
MSSPAKGLTFTAIDSTKLNSSEIYGNTLVELGEADPRVVALTADLAKSTKIGIFQERFPERFYNMGIAEQNLFGTAAGMAESGLIPFVSTFAIFTSMRAAEQVHTDICYPRSNVKIIATHAGTSFGQAGTTHHATEDLAVMRSIAGLTVISPADGIETGKAVRAAYEMEGPVYIRINRGFDMQLYADDDYDFEIGRSIQIRDGSDLTIIATGATVYQANEAAKILEKTDGLSVRVINMHSIKPLDNDAVLKALFDTRRIITVEDHNVLGGLGSAVAEVIAESRKSCSFRRLGIQDEFSIIGLHEDLMAHHGIDTNGILEAVRETMGMEFEEDDNWEDDF